MSGAEVHPLLNDGALPACQLGTLAIQVNCEDFSGGDTARPGRTENHEGFSVHWRFGEAEPYLTHRQDHWSGVYIGYQRLVACLNSHGVTVLKTYLHNPAKPSSPLKKSLRTVYQ